jgi:thiol-disulfide isomerase/thioredoxin
MSKAERRKVQGVRHSALDDRIKEKERAYVLFYAAWCPFSQRFLPIFEEYAKNNPRDCFSVIVDDEPDACEEYAIEYYPTVIMFKKGKVHKRLDAEPGVGLNKKQLKDITEK